MKRILPLLLLVPIAAWGYACANKSSSDKNVGPGQGDPGEEGPGGGGGPEDTGSSGGAGSSGGPADLTKNPIEGIAPPAVLLETGAYTDGPIWDAKQNVVFFTTPLGEGGLYRMREDGSAMKVRDGSRALMQIPIGNTVDKSGTLYTFEASRVMRGGQSADAGAPSIFAAAYTDTTGIDGGAGTRPFDTLNDGVVGPGGTMYVTDPGYYGNPIANHIFRITPDGRVRIVEAFEDVPRPNGIALSPDQKLLYVGFSQPQQGIAPFVRKYYVGADGTLGEHGKFVDIQPLDSEPDGIEVDQSGNLYVAIKQGILVLKSDGTKIGTIAVPEQPTGMAFGGKDLRTLFITTQGVKIFTVKVNVPGVVQ